MHSTPSKRPRLDPDFDKQTPNSNKNLIVLSLYNDSISFFSCFPIAWILPIQNIFVAFLVGHYQAHNRIYCLNSPMGPQTFYLSSPIHSQDLLSACQFVICQSLEKKRDKDFGTNDKKTDNFLEIVANEAFFLKNISDKSGSDIDTERKDENDNWKDKKPGSSIIAGHKLLWIDSETTIKV